MASNTKTPVEAAQELTKALADKLNELRKMDLPKTDDAANGGQESKGKIPSVSKQAGGTTDAEMNKEEMVATKKATCPGCGRKTAIAHESESGKKVIALCVSCKKKNVGNVQKMDLPHSDEAANGGKIKAEQARKKEMSSEETPIAEESSACEVHQKSELDALDVAQALSKAVVDKIAAVREQLVKMEQLEKAGNASMNKGIGSLPPSTPSVHQLATADQHTANNIFTILGKGEGQYAPWMKRAKPGKPKVGKEASAEGSGGDVKAGPLRGELKKDALPQVAKMPAMPTLKPGGVPGAKAGEAPKAPSAPKAPGATMAAKMELPQTDEAAIGGQEKAGSIPTMPKQAGGETDAEKDAGPGPAGSNLAEMNKMTLPHSSAKANGGQMRKDDIGMGVSLSATEMAKASPVFHVLKPSMAGQMKGAGNTQLTSPHDPGRANMHQQAMAGAFQPKGPVNSGLELARPNKAATLPKFSKSDLDAAKCPKCKNGMTLCKCSYGMK